MVAWLIQELPEPLDNLDALVRLILKVSKLDDSSLLAHDETVIVLQREQQRLAFFIRLEAHLVLILLVAAVHAVVTTAIVKLGDRFLSVHIDGRWNFLPMGLNWRD